MLSDDPEAPTTIKKRFNYPPLTGGKVRGSVIVDPGSVKAFDPLGARRRRDPGRGERGGRAATAPRVELPGRVPDAARPPGTRSP